MEKTIVALATPQGKSALAIIRISGKETYKIIGNIIKEKEKFKKEKERVIGVYKIKRRDGKEIDQVTAIKYKNPKSYTGEDMVEIISHGGVYVVEKIIEEIKNSGAEYAEKGEFTKRAFLNKKIDLIEAEAINCLIESNFEKQRENALKKINGKHKEIVKKWKDEIIEIIADIEAEIEFGEEENINNEKENYKKIENIEKKIIKEIEKSSRNKKIDNGIEIVIAGPTNAGKSTLFNKILGYERSIINKRAGTTRDTVSEDIILYGKQIRITDSAGIRKTDDEIENEGIKRTKKEIEKASVVIWITAADEKIKEEEKEYLKKYKNSIVVLNKIDIQKKDIEKEKAVKEIKNNIIKTSLKNENDERKVIKKIENEVKKILEKYEITDIIQTKRQEEKIKEIAKEIREIKKNWKRKEIIALNLYRIIGFIEEYTGKIDKEEIYNKVFEKFCIGK